MVRISVLNDALTNIVNAEKRGKRQVLIRPSSKVVVKFLLVMQKHGYIGEFEEIDDHRSGKIVIQLNGRLNKCGVISPRFNIKLEDVEKWVNNLLPSRQFGFLVLTTSSGIIDHHEARRKHTGGKILATVIASLASPKSSMLLRRNLSTVCTKIPRQTQRYVSRSTNVHSIPTLFVFRHIRPRLNSSHAKHGGSDSNTDNVKRNSGIIKLFGTLALGGVGASIYFYLRAKEYYESTKSKERKQKILSLEEATAKLRENQFTRTLPNKSTNGLVWRYDTNQVASNSPIEDTKIEMIYNTNEGDKLFFGVFDGHSGWNCSQYLSKNLIPLIKQQLDKAYVTLGNSDEIQLVKNTIQNAFLSLDYEIVFRSIEKLVNSLKDVKDQASGIMIEEGIITALAGSCALMAYIDSSKKNLYVASTGDSRAIIGIKDSETGDWKAIPLTEDMTGRNENEVKRLQAEHPDEGNIISHGRVFGGLEPTRAFGDARYKWDKVTHDLIFENLFLEKRQIPGGERNKTPPYVTARPEVTHHKISKDDKFLVLATDGLWERLSNDEVAKLVGGFLDGKSIQPIQSNGNGNGDSNDHVEENGEIKKPKHFAYVDENASTHLIRNALGGAVQEILCSLLSLPYPISRRYRDDITVTVVFFGEGN
ncbi:6555_t:CDS:2 [Ambispora leptoticha]|uniref:6555_t:CDS:1 n=1 Tax=Ambispora leptoticha TaxID=144679 RepID=A0A9N8ZLW5_9GLOM|nr:6555_t:CDS:2 [Ambispora leptoticha]